MSSPISVYSGKTPLQDVVYTSSDPSVAEVRKTQWSANIFLLKPGQAELIMTFPDDGNYQLRVPINVKNEFDWGCTIDRPLVTITAGSTKVGEMCIRDSSWASV